ARDWDPSGRLLRDVELQIDGFYQSNYADSANAAGIKALLNSKGWLVEQVTNVSTAWFPGVSGFSYKVWAVVATSYSDRQVQDQIRRDLAGFFNVGAISILSAPYVPLSGGNGGGNATYQETPKAVPTATPSSASPSSNFPFPQTDFWGNLGKGLGLSTPVVILGAAVLGLLILRK